MLWLGDRDEPDENAVVQPAYRYADRMVAALTERGHLNPAIWDAMTLARAGEPLEASLA